MHWRTQYFLTLRGHAAVENLLRACPEAAWYADRCHLLSRFFGHLSGENIRNIQYLEPTYVAAANRTLIPSVEGEVRDRFARLFGEMLVIAFATLVNTVHTLLTARKTTPLLTADTVRQELEASGIVSLFERAPTQLHAHRILVRELLICGRKIQADQLDTEPFVYRRHLQAGLNGWVSRNSTGKSTILKSIIWALTGVAPIFKDDVRPWLETIAIEVEIVDENVYTIWLAPRPHAPKVSGGIYAHDLGTVERDHATLHPIVAFGDERAMRQVVASFFADKLGFTTLEWVQWRQQTFNYTTRTISWDVYAQAMFIGADEYADYLFPRHDLNGKHHRNTLAMYLGVEGIDVVAKLQMQRDQAHSEFEFEKRRVEANAAEVRGKIARAGGGVDGG